MRQGLQTFARGVALRSQLPATANVWRTFAQTTDGSDSGLHDDFKPQIKAQPSVSAKEQIKQDVRNNKVFLYMKGTPDAPMCGFSNRACRILDAYGVRYATRNVLEDPELREGVKEYSDWPTIPQVYVDGEFMGGSDILMSMHESGELKKIFLDTK